jgi:hypothetical protein
MPNVRPTYSFSTSGSADIWISKFSRNLRMSIWLAGSLFYRCSSRLLKIVVGGSWSGWRLLSGR